VSVASITTQADIVELEILSDVEIERLTTERQRNATTDAGDPFPWRSRHERAWARTLRELELRPTPITEADLGATSELRLAVCYLVAAIAYESGESGADMDRARYYGQLHAREMAEVQLTLTPSGTVGREAWGSMRARRA
jgi:hypothetical protein